ncbi:MAG: DUF115 domain-containing protein [Lachnospiraceae bacterium]|nr:DUF115 domain-containing protein [Lachnospiraceae bacterium]
MMKFVIWGMGHRGKLLYELLGKEKVIAFIDSDPEKVGTSFGQCPVIDYGTYKKNYKSYAVIVSMVFGGGVTELLEKDGIFYFDVEDCPPEFMGYGLNTARRALHGKKLEFPDHIILYGGTLYTVLVYEKLLDEKYQDVSVFLPSSMNENARALFCQMFPEIRITQTDEIEAQTLLLTEKVSQLEPELENTSVTDIADWSKFISGYQNPKIEAFQDKYHGKRCFIVATGPSLTYEDLACLYNHQEFCIGINSIFTCFPETSWRPDCYTVLDAGGISMWQDEFPKLADIPYKFIADCQPYFDYAQLDGSWYVYHSILDRFSIRNMQFSDDFSQKAYNGGTVIYVCIQLAVYMGFQEIYLLGLDFSYKKNVKSHFTRQAEPDEKYDGMNEQNRIQDISYLAFQKAKEYASEHGIRICNATRKTCLDVFEQVEFDSLFQG